MIRVLYIDDEPALLNVTKMFLEHSGELSVDTVSSTKLALEKLQTSTYDAVVSDYQMPDMNGITLLKIVRGRYPALPFILFTGKGREEVVIEALNSGADFYLQKGGDPKPQFTELVHKIRQAVQRRKTEISLDESERRYRDVVETQTEFITRFKPDGTHMFVNEAYCRVFGKQREDFLGKRFIPEIPLEDRDLLSHHFASLTKDNPVADIEHRLILQDGSIRWHWWNDRAFFDDLDNVIEYQSIGKDITERKRAEEELRAAYEQLAATGEELQAQYDALKESQQKIQQSEKDYRSILENIQDAYYRSDTGGNIILASPSSATILGYDNVTEFYGKNIADTFYCHPEEREKFFAEMQKSGSVTNYEMTLVKRDGTPVTVMTSSQNYYDAAGNFLGIEGIFRDITERKQNENQIVRLSELKERLLGTSSHDEQLRLVSNAVVDIFDADFSRIWLIRDADLCEKGCRHASVTSGPDSCLNRKQCLHLVSSSGRYTHTDGEHRRVPFGSYKIGRIASGNETYFVTNDVTHDPQVHDQAWAASCGLVSFAGFRLLSLDLKPVGVLALFRNRAVLPREEKLLADLANTLSYVIISNSANSRIRESEERYRNVVEDQTEFISRFLPDGTHIFVNDAYCRYFGMQRENIIGLRFIPQIPEEERGLLRSHFLSLTRNNPTGTVEHRIIMPDGSIRWQRWSDRAIYDESGTLIEYQSVGRDITDRKTAELELMEKNEELHASYEQLAAAEEELRSSYDDLAKSQRALELEEITLNAIIQESPIPQFVIDRDHRILYWNQALAAKCGIAADEVRGTDQQWRAFYLSERPCLADLLVDGLLDRIPKYYPGKYEKSDLVDRAYEVTDFFPHMDQEGKWLHFTAGLIRNRNGDIIGAVESLEDISDRKTAELDLVNKNEELGAAYEQLAAIEEELRNNFEELGQSQRALLESELRYRNVVEDQTEFISRFLPDGTHMFVNDAYCRYFNIQRENIIGKKFIPGIPEDDQGLVKKHFASLTRENPTAIVTHRIIMPDGSIRWQRWSDRAIYDTGGTLVEYQSVGRDISEQKQSEEALRQANHQLNLMTSITRHDINNKISIILGYLDIAKEKSMDPALEEYFVKITSATDAIQTLIADTRIYQDLGIHEPRWQEVDRLLPRSQVPLTVTLNSDLEGVEVFADPMLRRVFFNLLDNSIRHGQHVTEIRMSSCHTDDGLKIVWEDNGAGVAAEEKEKIFERGFGKNTGLGLFFVREILSLTGITIKETGTCCEGARFEITVPEGGYRFTEMKGQR